jgi:3-deoxy-D-manno-octulosonic-acid transferase
MRGHLGNVNRAPDAAAVIDALPPSQIFLKEWRHAEPTAVLHSRCGCCCCAFSCTAVARAQAAGIPASHRRAFRFYSAQRPAVIGCIRLGETRATQASSPGCAQPIGSSILLTHTTPTGSAAGGNCTATACCACICRDYPFAVNHFLRHFKPRLAS